MTGRRKASRVRIKPRDTGRRTWRCKDCDTVNAATDRKCCVCGT